MRSIWLIFGGLLALLLGVRFYPRQAPPGLVASRPTPSLPVIQVVERRAAQPTAPDGRRDSLVRFALRQVGVPYLYAGISPVSGFDCSGFVYYVFAHFGVPTPHSTALLISVGQPVARADAQPGDIVVFTGTAPTSTTPGHAGIVISGRGETPLRFVHASSAQRESGVKISQVENSGYERRFMQVRRVLAANELGAAGTRVAPPTAARRAGPEAALPRPVAALPPVPAGRLPTRVAPLPAPRLARAKVRAAPSRRAAKTQPRSHSAAARTPKPTKKHLAPTPLSARVGGKKTIPGWPTAERSRAPLGQPGI